MNYEHMRSFYSNANISLALAADTQATFALFLVMVHICFMFDCKHMRISSGAAPPLV